MGWFDLPSRELELKIDGKWTSVMFNDRLTSEELNECVKAWKENHEVTGARYDGSVIYEDEDIDFVFIIPDPFNEPPSEDGRVRFF